MGALGLTAVAQIVQSHTDIVVGDVSERGDDLTPFQRLLTIEDGEDALADSVGPANSTTLHRFLRQLLPRRLHRLEVELEGDVFAELLVLQLQLGQLSLECGDAAGGFVVTGNFF